MKNYAVVVGLLLMLVVSGCGYSLPGRGGNLPDDIRTVFITPIANTTAEPFIETGLTNEMRNQFARRQTLNVVSADNDADAVLSLTIVSYNSTSISYNDDDDISEYRVTITVRGSLVRTADDSVLWNGTSSWHEQYFSNDNRAEQKSHEKKAQLVVQRRLAQEVYNSITDNF